MKRIVEISEKELVLAEENPLDYLFLLLSKYYETIEVDPTVESGTGESETYSVLVAYNVLIGEVFNGGFLELIYNGYAEFIFNDVFSNSLREWGAVKIASNIEKAKALYANIILHEKTIGNDFCDVDSQFSDFSRINSEFFTIIYDETEKISTFIKKNFNDFAIVA
jgi:hypothetical protein